MSSASPCEWYGLQCNDQKEIIAINLDENRLKGKLPVELASFCCLEEVNLSFNELVGVIPPQLGDLITLNDDFEIEGNRLTGTIPRQLGNLKNLADPTLETKSTPQAARPVALKQPGEVPSKAEVESHNLSHIPCCETLTISCYRTCLSSRILPDC